MYPEKQIESSLRHNYAQVNGVRLHYAESGSSNDLVILLHGFPEFWYSWRHQLTALGERYHVVAPDLRGYNLSDKPSRVEDYRIELLVEDVIALIEHFGVRQAAIVGHDWGAGVAWAVAHKHPERVSKLVVLDEAIERYKDALRQPGALTAALNYYRANVFRLMSRRPRVGENTGHGRVRVSTLFIFGEQDIAILPATVQGIARYVDAPYREVRIADSGHWVQNEAVDEVNSVLLDFLK